tara:strand:- start:87 stop:956 length:870 start_codon:yes stop_codon:yes gene_type:complete
MKPITNEEMDKIDRLVNNFIQNSSEVTTRIMTPKAAIEKGALAFFGEKYGEEVRVVSMGKEKEKYFSTELCGGTHVKKTSDIGKFKTINQSSIAAGVRRIEALRDKQLENYLKNKEKLFDISAQKDEEIIRDLSSQISNLGGKPIFNKDDKKLLIKELSNQYDNLFFDSIIKDKEKNIICEDTVNNIKVRFQTVNDLNSKDLRKVVDLGKKELGNGIIIVFSTKDEKVSLAVGVTDDLTKKFNAVEFVKLGSELIGGKGGGGRKDFAQAGGNKKEMINFAFGALRRLIT